MIVVPHYFPHDVQPHLLLEIGQMAGAAYRGAGIARQPGMQPVPIECWYSPAAVLWTLHEGRKLTGCLLGVVDVPGRICGQAPWPVGLPCEHTFDPTWRLALAGRVGVEICMFAGRPGADGMMALFRTAYEWARGVGGYLVCEAHPRRRVLYYRLLGMKQIAPTRTLAGSTVEAALFGTDQHQAEEAGALVLNLPETNKDVKKEVDHGYSRN